MVRQSEGKMNKRNKEAESDKERSSITKMVVDCIHFTKATGKHLQGQAIGNMLVAKLR